MKVICFTGRSGSGKDEAAKIMKSIIESIDETVLIVHYADLLKFILSKYCGWDGNKDEHGRDMLQQIGTDMIRKERPNYWVDFTKDIIHWFGKDYDYVLIPDCRFPNEIEELKSAGHDVWVINIQRKNRKKLQAEQEQHSSETALDNYHCNYQIINSDYNKFKLEVLYVTTLISISECRSYEEKRVFKNIIS